MRPTISEARSASLTTQPSASIVSSRFGGFSSKKRMPARALLRAVAMGCRISWAILDVRQQNVPADNAAGVIAYWDAAVIKPSIFAVEATQPLFDLVGNS